MNDVQNQRLPLLTEEQQKYIAWLLTSRRSGDDDMRVAGVLSEARVDLNPHQVEAALFALKSPFSKGVVLADEVGLGKTIEAGIVISQYWAEQKRRILIIVPATLRRQWSTEMEEKFFLKSEILERGSLISPDIILRKHHLFICSYQYAAKYADQLSQTNWDLVVIDEAHKLRNVYKNSSAAARRISEAFRHNKKGSGIMILAFTGLALAGGAAWGWIVAAVVADAAIVAASSYSAYAGAQAQRDAAKAQARQEQIAAEQYKLQAQELERQSQIEQEKAGIAQIQAEQEAERRSRILAADIGSTYANAAGNGLLVDANSTDTFANVLKTQAYEAAEDIATIRDNGRINVWEHQTNAKSLLVSAKTGMLSSQSSLIGAAAAKKNAKYYNTASYLGATTAGIATASSAVSSGIAGASYAKRNG